MGISEINWRVMTTNKPLPRVIEQAHKSGDIATLWDKTVKEDLEA